MKFLIETMSGKKGIKTFTDINEYIDYMTHYGSKIKSIVESEVPYSNKPVELPKSSGSNGWEQVDKKAFGDVLGKAEKGESVLNGDGKESIVKDDAKFSSSKSSEKEDKQETPKVEESSVKSENESVKGFKEFKYEKSEDESEKEDKEELDEGWRDNLKKAGKYAKGAMVGGAMMGALASGNAQANTQIDPSLPDGADKPYENVVDYDTTNKVQNINGYEYTQEELKKIQDEYNLSDEEMEVIKNGQDPFAEGCGSKIKETEKPSFNDVDYEDDLTDSDKEMYDGEIKHILEIWDTLSIEEQEELKRLLFSKSEKETLNEEMPTDEIEISDLED